MTKERLTDRIPPGALDAFDDQLESGADQRRALRALGKETVRVYGIKLANYQRWCASVGYQPDPAFITDARVEEHVRYLMSSNVRAAPSTIKQAISALTHYAERAAVDPMPSMRSARNVLKTYQSELQRHGLIAGG